MDDHSTRKERTMMELFRVDTTVKEFRGRKNLLFEWFYRDLREGRPYAELVENYNPGDRVRVSPGGEGTIEDLLVYGSEVAIDELFTAIEAKALKDYIDREYGDDGTTTIEKAELPIPNNTSGLGDVGIGCGADYYA
jgi:hypothetical protein